MVKINLKYIKTKGIFLVFYFHRLNTELIEKMTQL